MELTQQVTSLEISQRLKELGVKQESLFYFAICKPEFNGTDHDIISNILNKKESEIYFAVKQWDMYSAFTVSELGEMLPWQIQIENVSYFWEVSKNGKNFIGKEYEFGYQCSRSEEEPKFVSADTEADARGKMMIYLLENKLI